MKFLEVDRGNHSINLACVTEFENAGSGKTRVYTQDSKFLINISYENFKNLAEMSGSRAEKALAVLGSAIQTP